MSRHQPTQPTTVEIEPYIGPHDQVLAQLVEAQAAGRILRTRPIQQLDNGTVLVVAELRPTSTDPAESPREPRFGRWSPYLLAGGSVLLAAVGAVLLFLFVVGLHALVTWGLAHAVQIGVGIAFAGVTALVFLGALAKARHGYPGRGYHR